MGAGINLFRQLFPEDYYAYQTAHLESSKPVSKKIYDSNNQLIAEINLGGDELRGLLKVVDGQLVAYGDVKPSDGNGTEVFDIVDLGTLDWTYYTSGTNPIFYANISGSKVYSSSLEIPNAICFEYQMVGVNNRTNLTSTLQNKESSFIIDGTNFTVRNDSYTDAIEFKTAMSGKYLIYEKATPTAKSYTPFTNPMLCGSTEEFTDSRTLKMFCGHQSQYYTETEGDKLSALPEVTGEQGDFIINNADGKMTLKKRNVYSETEQIVGTWIDGRPIYEKTLTGTFEEEDDTIAMSAGYGVLAIISAEGFIISDDLTSSKLIDGGDGAVYFYGVTEDGVLVKRDSTSTCGSTPTAYVTIQYVKTT